MQLPLETPWPNDASLTHLDPVESTVASKIASPSVDEPPTPSPLTDNFLHSGWKADRERIYEGLRAIYAPLRRLAAFATCANSRWVLRNKQDPTRFKIVLDRCHDRFCVPCAGHRQATIRHNLARYLGTEPHRFLTLTVRSLGEPLEHLLDHLYRSFRRLRHRRLWKERVRGGAAFLEITWNEPNQTWHPHLHCMLQGSYIDRPELSQLWLAATGDSHNLDLRYIRSKHDVIRYITKYATKPLPASVVHNPRALEEALHALHKRRTLLTFGAWTNWKLLADPDDKDWEIYAHLDELNYRASNDDLIAENILAMIPLADPHTHEFTLDLEQFP